MSYNISMLLKSALTFALLMPTCFSQVTSPNLPDEGILTEDTNGHYVKKRNYGKFTGRVSDKDEYSNVLKIHVENGNVKFFKAGDRVAFTVGDKGNRRCYATVQGTEPQYFTVHTLDIRQCNDGKAYIRRGTILHFNSELLQKRVFMASKHREMLLLQRQDFLKQLSELNHFVWTFDQQRVKTATEYDRKILEVQRMKQKALDELTIKKQDSVTLQVTLRKKLDELDDQLNFYRVERNEPMVDRWSRDHDLGLPVKNRPQRLKAKR
jgi:hypothetical protein